MRVLRTLTDGLRRHQAAARSACWRIQACIATPAATPALIDRVEPNWAMETTRSALLVGDAGHARALLPEQQQAGPGQLGGLQPPSPGHIVDGHHGQLVPTGEGDQLGDRVVVVQPQVAVGDHGPAAVPAASAHDVHPGRAERVRGAHHGADVVVVPEVLDGDVERVRAGGQVGGHRIPSPVAVGVDHVAGVAVLEQLGVVALGRRPGSTARPATGRRRPGPAPAHSLGSAGSGDLPARARWDRPGATRAGIAGR